MLHGGRLFLPRHQKIITEMGISTRPNCLVLRKAARPKGMSQMEFSTQGPPQNFLSNPSVPRFWWCKNPHWFPLIGDPHWFPLPSRRVTFEERHQRRQELLCVEAKCVVCWTCSELQATCTNKLLLSRYLWYFLILDCITCFNFCIWTCVDWNCFRIYIDECTHLDISDMLPNLQNKQQHCKLT